ncbi:Os05g0316133, partial [Oryza sativa Japonica Group]
MECHYSDNKNNFTCICTFYIEHAYFSILLKKLTFLQSQMKNPPLKIPNTTQLPLPYICPSCTRSKLAANITPAASPLQSPAHWASSSRKKNGRAPKPVAAAIASVDHATVDTGTFPLLNPSCPPAPSSFLSGASCTTRTTPTSVSATAETSRTRTKSRKNRTTPTLESMFT